MHQLPGGLRHELPVLRHRQAGLDRNLSTAEIVHQIVDGMRALRTARSRWARAAEQHRLHGHGRAPRQLQPRRGGHPPAHRPRARRAGLSQRGITVSTVGLVPAIHRFSDEGFKCRLAISLHAPDDELRDTLVPVNTRWKVREVLDAGFEYAAKSGRRLSIEYA